MLTYLELILLCVAEFYNYKFIMYMKEFVFFCLGAIVAILVMEGIRLAVETRQKILRDYVLENYKVKNMRLFDEWLGRLSWREISSYKKKLDGFCVPDETSEFLDSFTV